MLDIQLDLGRVDVSILVRQMRLDPTAKMVVIGGGAINHPLARTSPRAEFWDQPRDPLSRMPVLNYGQVRLIAIFGTHGLPVWKFIFDHSGRFCDKFHNPVVICDTDSRLVSEVERLLCTVAIRLAGGNHGSR